jgi:hypothetical protein
MERPRNDTHVGSLGWAGIAGFVLWFDTTRSESLSHAFKRGLENERSRPLMYAALGITALHLLDKIPHAPIELDPFYAASNLAIDMVVKRRQPQ